MKLCVLAFVSLSFLSCSHFSGPSRTIAQDMKASGKVSSIGQLSDFRSESFRKMLMEDNFVSKIDYAHRFFKSMELQALTDSEADMSDEVLLTMKRDAVHELVLKSEDLYHSLKPQMKGNESDSNHQSFFALALALHVNSAKRKPEVSVLDLVTETLSKKEELMKVEEANLPSYQRIILDNETFFLRLVEARVKVIPLYVLSKMSGGGNSLMRKMDLLFRQWEPADINEAQVFFLTEAMGLAINDKLFLKSLKLFPDISPQTVKMFKNAKFKNSQVELEKRIKEFLEP